MDCLRSSKPSWLSQQLKRQFSRPIKVSLTQSRKSSQALACSSVTSISRSWCCPCSRTQQPLWGLAQSPCYSESQGSVDGQKAGGFPSEIVQTRYHFSDRKRLLGTCFVSSFQISLDFVTLYLFFSFLAMSRVFLSFTSRGKCGILRSNIYRITDKKENG